jgi:hypothetical protein
VGSGSVLLVANNTKGDKMVRDDSEIVNDIDKKVMELNQLICEANISGIDIELKKLNVDDISKIGAHGNIINSYLFKLIATKKLTSDYIIGTGPGAYNF